MLWSWIRTKVRQAILEGIKDALETLGESEDLPQELADIRAADETGQPNGRVPRIARK